MACLFFELLLAEFVCELLLAFLLLLFKIAAAAPSRAQGLPATILASLLGFGRLVDTEVDVHVNGEERGSDVEEVAGGVEHGDVESGPLDGAEQDKNALRREDADDVSGGLARGGVGLVLCGEQLDGEGVDGDVLQTQ